MTAGRPIMLLSTTTAAPRPGKRATATSAPSGRPTSVAIATAVRLTRSDSSTISTTSPSKVRSRPKAWSSESVNIARV
jgi:hypothetical protein